MEPRILFATAVALSVSLAGCGRNASEPKDSPSNEAPPVLGSAPVAGTPLDEERAQERTAKSLERLLQQLPKSMAPKPGPNGIIERNEANAWLEKNIVDKSIEVLLPVADLQIRDVGEGRHDIDLLLGMDEESEVPKQASNGHTLGSLPLGGIPCRVKVRAGSPTLPDVDAATAKELRKLKGNQVLFKARITGAEFHEDADDKQLLLEIGLTDLKALDSFPIGVWLDEDDVMPRRRAAGVVKGATMNGVVKMYDSRDRLVCLDTFKDGIHHGQRVWYYPSGAKWREVNFVDGLSQGKQTSWYEDGNKAAEMFMVDGKLNGPFFTYYRNGKKRDVATHAHGKLEGRSENYLPDGRLFEVGMWVDGKQVKFETLIKLTPEESRQVDEGLLDLPQWKALWGKR